MIENTGMVHKVAFIWAVLFVFVALAGGFVLGMSVGRGELKKPVTGASYELAIVAKSGKGISTRYYSFEKYYPGIKDLESNLAARKTVFESGSFRILESQEKKK